MRLLMIAAIVLGAALPGTSQPARRIAFTLDDLPTVQARGTDIAQAERVTRDLVAALVRNKVPAIGFVNEAQLHTNGAVDPRRVALLQQWVDAGLELGNHTFSHRDLHKVPVAEFERDIIEGEKITRELLRKARRDIRYFRHPYLHTGRDRATRDRVEKLLKSRGYRVAPVTIDHYDYLFAAAFDRAGAAERPRVYKSYLDYMEQVIAFYEGQTQRIARRAIAHTFLLHANALNAAALDDLARMLNRRGYTFVSLDEALKDPAYTSPDSYYGPAGISWLHRWAITVRMPRSIFKGEPEVPRWIVDLAKTPAAR